jgi:hypothetical protein
MRFIFMGFSHLGSLRRLRYHAVLADGTRSEITVDADLPLCRKNRVDAQELPLMGKMLLEASENVPASMVLTEAAMQTYTELRDRNRPRTGSFNSRSSGGILGSAAPDATAT